MDMLPSFFFFEQKIYWLIDSLDILECSTFCRMDECALPGSSSEGISKSVSLDGARRMALKNIEAFVQTFSDPQAFASAAASSAPAALVQVTERARIQEAGHLRCRFTQTPWRNLLDC